MALSFDEIFAVMAAASKGDLQARVSLPAGAEPDDPAVKLATAVNILLEDLAHRTSLLEESHKGTRLELERLVAERTEQLRQSEEKFSKAFMSSPAAISIAKLPEGLWLDMNDALAKMIGYPREQLIGRISSEMGLVDASERAKILEAIRVHGRVRDVEIQLRTEAGIKDTLLSTEQIELNGQTCALTIQYDITNLKNAERDVRRLNQDLERGQAALEAANKELEAFSYSVAHDLRAPLRSVDGFSQALLDGYSDKVDETGKKYLHFVREAAQRMDQLIKDLLNLSRVTRSDLIKAPVDLSALARDVLASLQRSEPGRKAEIAVSEGVVAHGDARLLRIVLENLLDNAWKFTSKIPLARIEFGTDGANGTPAYFVRDNGAGFDQTYSDKLFGVFQRLHPATEFDGTGIGLATVHRIIRRHGGRIWGEGEVGRGAAFHFTLEERT